MTLLESIVGLVILSLSAIGVLGIFHQGNRASENANEWSVASAYAEQGMETAKIGKAAIDDVSGTPLPPGYSRSVEFHPWTHGMADVAVVVTMPSGARLMVHRLVAAR